MNIEKEARLSGQTHDKGVQIITGFLGQTYAQNFPLSLSCRVCFEQNYNGIDGDSASSTELYCILSSLAELPIRQDLAVTGSVNQKGEIQAIGGVTHKIEGFFDLCRKRGLTGTQGVMIPVSNVKEDVYKRQDVSYRGQSYREAREMLARAKDFCNAALKRKPRLLGDAIPVSGNGDSTND